MLNDNNYIRMFATSFLIEDHRQSIEYRLIPKKYCYELNQRVHSGVRICDYLTDWENISHYTNLHDAILEIFDRLRSMEIENGLYKELNGTNLPFEVYARKIDQWVNYATRLEVKFFSIHGNHSKYLPKPSPEMKAFYLQVYESLKENWQLPSVNDLWFEELIKKEISNHYETHFGDPKFEAIPLEDFLKKYYTDFEDQIDRYMLHLDFQERAIKVTPENRKRIQRDFEHHLLRDEDAPVLVT